MLRATNIIGLAACIILCAGQPIDKAPVLKEQPAEVLFRVGSQPAVLECILDGQDKDVKYSWHKDGKELKLTPNIVQRKGEGSITFNKPAAEDEGVYQCFAETHSGIASTRRIHFKRAYINQPQYKVQEHTPVDSRPYKMECKIPDSYPAPTIVWKSHPINNPAAIENVLDRKITLSPDGNLWFSEVLPKDANKKYICVAESPAEDKEIVLAEHIMKDLVKDTKKNDGELVPQYLSNDMMAKAGDVTMIYCIYGGKPLAFPDWFKDGKNVNGDENIDKQRITRHNRTSGKRLLIKDTYLEDQGTIKCIANNEVGKPQEHSIKLTVVSAPKYETKPEKQIAAKEGQDVKIPCKVTGLPAPKVTWTYNSKPLNNPRVKVTDQGLVISKVQKADRGYYGCQAVNEHGEEYAETLLQV